MRYNRFGQTGLFVSELCLGTMTFGGSDGLWGQIGMLGQEEAERLVARSLEAGINFIDTADVYAGGRSEEITGQALKNLKVPREDVVVATKVFGQTGEGPNSRGASRAHILAAVKASLRRLSLDDGWNADPEDRVAPTWEADEAAYRFEREQRSEEVEDFLDWALPQLGSDQRRVIDLTHHGATVPEIMDELGITQDNAYQLRRRGLQNLKKLKEQYDA